MKKTQKQEIEDLKNCLHICVGVLIVTIIAVSSILMFQISSNQDHLTELENASPFTYCMEQYDVYFYHPTATSWLEKHGKPNHVATGGDWFSWMSSTERIIFSDKGTEEIMGYRKCVANELIIAVEDIDILKLW